MAGRGQKKATVKTEKVLPLEATPCPPPGCPCHSELLVKHLHSCPFQSKFPSVSQDAPARNHPDSLLHPHPPQQTLHICYLKTCTLSLAFCELQPNLFLASIPIYLEILTLPQPNTCIHTHTHTHMHAPTCILSHRQAPTQILKYQCLLHSGSFLSCAHTPSQAASCSSDIPPSLPTPSPLPGPTSIQVSTGPQLRLLSTSPDRVSRYCSSSGTSIWGRFSEWGL